MAARLKERRSPNAFKPWARSAVMFLVENPIPTNVSQHWPVSISSYALAGDYHFVCKGILNEIEKRYNEAFSPYPFYGFVDTAPVSERTLAANAGLGWIGKNGCLIHPKFGSNTYICGFFTCIPSEPTVAMKERCGRCTQCLTSCPTRAIRKPKILDARRCLSYLTIECKSEFKEYAHHLNNRIFGCDTCQSFCPWNKQPDANKTAGPDKHPYQMDEVHWFKLLAKGGGFKAMFKHSPIYRTGRKRILRNLLYILIHQKEHKIIQQIKELPFHEDDTELIGLHKTLLKIGCSVHPDVHST